MPASPATPPRRRSTTAPRCAATRAIRNCSAAPSWRCSQNGEIDEAVRLADRLLQVDKNDRVARLVLGVRAIKQKQYVTARQQLAQSVRGPITDLAATLLPAWTNVGPTESKAAIETIDKLAGPESYDLLKDLHAGLILDLLRPPARCAQAAGARLQARRDRAAGRAGLRQPAFARWATGTRRLKVFQALDEALPRHPLVH